MISQEDSRYTYEYPSYYKILPSIHEWHADELRIKNGIKVPDNFHYSSDKNNVWMSTSELKNWILANHHIVGKL